jgi:hypothetical protein
VTVATLSPSKFVVAWSDNSANVTGMARVGTFFIGGAEVYLPLVFKSS